MKKTFALTLLVVACSGEQLDVGDNGEGNQVENGGSGGAGATAGTEPATTGGSGAVSSAGAGGTGAVASSGAAGAGGSATPPSGPELPDWSSVGTCPGGETPSVFVGTWEGALEDFFLNPVVPVQLVIDEATLDGACGTLTWGVGSPPPPSLSDPENRGDSLTLGAETGQPLRGGLTYTILEGAARDETLRVGVTESEYFVDYCANQEEVYFESRIGQWQCMPPWDQMSWDPAIPGDCTVQTTEGTVITYPTKHCAVCTPPASPGGCVCNSGGCAAPTTATQLFDFTLERASTGDRLVMPWLGEHTITLTRVE